MASMIRPVIDGYNYMFYEQAHPVTRDWFLASNPIKLAVILAGYLYFCTRFGPRYMRDRKPYNLKNVVLVYNVFQVALSLYMAYLGCYFVFIYDFNYCCQPLHTDRVIMQEVASGIWLYFMAKVSELLDTIFFVLRKSDRQVTSLHLHHHTIMPIMTWLSLMYYPGGQIILIGTLNSLVHFVMYIYYLLAGMGEKYQKYTWWKKYVTIIQLIQFSVLAAHHINSLFYTCGYPVVLKFICLGYFCFFLRMFGQFYYHTYVKVKKGIKNGVHETQNKEKNGIKNNSQNHDTQNKEKNGIKNNSPNHDKQNNEKNGIKTN